MRSGHPIQPWLQRLRALPRVRAVDLHQDARSSDARLILHAPHVKQSYRIEIKRANPLGYAMLEPLLARAKHDRDKWLLLASYIPGPMGARLHEGGVDYLDLAGNCHIDAGSQYFVHVEGRKPVPRTRKARFRTAGQQLLFVLAANPALVQLPVRELALLAGGGKSATGDMLSRLLEDGLIAETSRGRQVLRRDEILDRWTSAYPNLRRLWLQGRYRMSVQDPRMVERAIANSLTDETWAWGGSAAAMKLVHHSRGQETVLHVPQAMPELPKRIRALPDRAGPIIVLTTPIPFALRGPMPHVAHPLLVYSELLASGDERASAAATMVREKYFA